MGFEGSDSLAARSHLPHSIRRGKAAAKENEMMGQV
jgi:hypothetical protein